MTESGAPESTRVSAELTMSQQIALDTLRQLRNATQDALNELEKQVDALNERMDQHLLAYAKQEARIMGGLRKELDEPTLPQKIEGLLVAHEGDTGTLYWEVAPGAPVAPEGDSGQQGEDEQPPEE